MKHRLLAGAMAFCMTLSLIPTAALAADRGADRPTTQYYSDVADLIEPGTSPDTEAEPTDEAESESAPALPTEVLPADGATNSATAQNDSEAAALTESVTSPDIGTEETDEAESSFLTDEEGVYFSDVSDIIGPITPPDTGTEEPNKPENEPVTLPDTDAFHSNADFKPYDPGYPEKEQYGNYVLRVPALKDRLTFSTGNQNQLIGTLYAPGVSNTHGWKDATKQWGNVDTGLCFAASSSNLISWYLERYLALHPDDTHGFETHPERIFDRFRNGWDSAEGGDQKEALSWYFTGGFPSNSPNPNGSELTGREDGGYLLHQLPNNSSNRWSEVSYDWKPQEAFTVYGSFEDNRFPYIEEVGGVSPGRAFSTLKSFSQHILRQLHYGPCTISIIADQTGGGAGHAITLWGVDYDVDTGLVTRIHVTDSDDTSNIGLFSVKIESGPNNDGVRLVQYPYHPPAGTPTRFTRIRDSIVMYAPDVVRANHGYTGPDAEINGLTPDADGTGVTVQVSNISSASLEYGYSYDNDPNHVIQWQDDSHFSELKPDQYYFFARVKETSDHAAGGTSAPYAYRVNTPSPVAQDTVAALGLGTSLLRPYNGTYQYIWYGTEHGENGTAAEEPILWRVLDTKTNMQTEGLFLISDKLYGTGTDGGLHFSAQPPYRNDYSVSSARRWCQEFAQANLNSLEQSAILLTTKTDAPYTSAFDGAPLILSNDKVFLPSAEEITSAAYGFGTDASRQARYRSGAAAYWLRSPAAQEHSNAGYVTAAGAVAHQPTTNSSAARPAFNLDGNQVLYVAAVNNGTVSDRLGLEQITSVQSQDFRLVLKDTDRAFRVTSSELTVQPGESVTLGYEGAQLSQSGSEFLSVILMDTDGTTPLYYGKIAAVQSESGSIRFDLPSGLADGAYVLKVFNEQYNGQKESGIASDFCDVTLNIETPHIAAPIPEVNLTLTAPVTGQAPQKALAGEDGYIVESTTWNPADSVFQPNTDYTVSLVLKANADHTFTKDTVFTLNGNAVVPVAEGDRYVITYDAFPTTEDDNNGGETGGGSDSGNNGGETDGGSDSGNNGGETDGGSDSGNNGGEIGGGSISGNNSGNSSDSNTNGNADSGSISGSDSSHSANTNAGGHKPDPGKKPPMAQTVVTTNQTNSVTVDQSDATQDEGQTATDAKPLTPPTEPDGQADSSAGAESVPSKDETESSDHSFLPWILLAILIPVVLVIVLFALKRRKVKTR